MDNLTNIAQGVASSATNLAQGVVSSAKAAAAADAATHVPAHPQRAGRNHATAHQVSPRS